MEALARKGITVTIELVYKVKKTMKKAAQKTPATNGAKTVAPAAAKKNGDINKSEEIRTVLKATPSASAKDVVAKLADKGVLVTEGLVYAVKQSMKKSKKKGRATIQKVSTNGHATNGAATGNPIQIILKVKSLAGDVGGIKSLKQLVDALAE